MFLLNTNNYFRVRDRVRVRFRVTVRVSVLLNTFKPHFSVGEPAVRINSDILVSAKLQLYRWRDFVTKPFEFLSYKTN